jgi:hypothetical protein
MGVGNDPVTGGNVRKTVVMTLAVLMLGCASLRPTIDQGEYQNYRYGFIVRLPEQGWDLAKSIPVQYAADFTSEAGERTMLLLYNQKTRGLIAVQAGTLFLSYERILTFQERLTEFVEPFLDVDWLLLVKGDPEVRGNYHIYQCDSSGLRWQEKEGKRKIYGIRHTSTGAVYPLKGETCSVTFYLFSDPETFDENVVALNRMARSFSSGEVFTMRAYSR